MIAYVLVGDASHDGHGMTNHIFYEVSDNIKLSDIEVAYKEGAVKTGFNLDSHSNGIAVNYDDNVMPLKDLEKLVELGLDTSLMNHDWDDEDVYLSSICVAELYMFLASTALDFKYKRINFRAINNSSIGYGVFSL